MQSDRWWHRTLTEKERISDLGSTGAYYFAHAGTFIEGARDMIEESESVMGEFYVMPIYQRLIEAGKQIGVSIDKMRDMGTPNALAAFLDDPPPSTDIFVMLRENSAWLC